MPRHADPALPCPDGFVWIIERRGAWRQYLLAPAGGEGPCVARITRKPPGWLAWLDCHVDHGASLHWRGALIPAAADAAEWARAHREHLLAGLHSGVSPQVDATLLQRAPKRWRR